MLYWLLTLDLDPRYQRQEPLFRQVTKWQRHIQRVDSWTISYRNMTQNFDICIKTYNVNTNLYHNWILLGDQAWLQSGWIWPHLKISCKVILKSFGEKQLIAKWSNWMCSFALWVMSFSFQDTVSVHRPGFYAERFQQFMCNTVFKKIPRKELCVSLNLSLAVTLFILIRNLVANLSFS